MFKEFANPPIERKGKLLIYYGGKTGTVSLDEGDEPFQAMCLATLRKDGFVSLRAGNDEGELITRPLLVTGRELRVNVKGPLKVEVQDRDGVPIAGYTSNECDPLPEDGLDLVMRWQGNDLNRLLGTAIRLRFTLRNADLFSLRFTRD